MLQVPQEVVLELTDDTYPRKEETPVKQNPSRSAVVDVPLQPLDARSLLATRAVLQTTSNREKSIASSTPPSSLDLEWEHEGVTEEEEGCESVQNGTSAAELI
ncbi:hypothetical protein L9F63_010894, partial [Diploptera punctata]